MPTQGIHSSTCWLFYLSFLLTFFKWLILLNEKIMMTELGKSQPLVTFFPSCEVQRKILFCYLNKHTIWCFSICQLKNMSWTFKIFINSQFSVIIGNAIQSLNNWENGKQRLHTINYFSFDNIQWNQFYNLCDWWIYMAIKDIRIH